MSKKVEYHMAAIGLPYATDGTQLRFVLSGGQGGVVVFYDYGSTHRVFVGWPPNPEEAVTKAKAMRGVTVAYVVDARLA